MSREANTAPRQAMPAVIPALMLSFQLFIPSPVKAFPVEAAGSAIPEAAPLRVMTAPIRCQASTPRASIDLSTTINQLEATSQLSRSALAVMLGVSRPTFYSWAAGKPVRHQNAERTVALLAAMQRLASFQQGRALPALWQHQRLPDLGVTFIEGSQQGIPLADMADALIALWKRDRSQVAVLDTLFAARS